MARNSYHVPGMYIGLDLGQAVDYTALTIVEKQVPTAQAPATYRPGDLWQNGQPVRPVQVRQPPIYLGRHLQRFPKGTSYPDIMKAVQAHQQALAQQKHYCQLVVDATGCGRPVIDMFRAAQMQPHPITITGGDSVTYEDGYYRVPKRDLVGGLQVMFQTGRLKFASSLPDADILQKELLNFKVKITLAANDVYGEWREGHHDDLVLAVALAAWYADQDLCYERGPGSISMYNTSW